jgi:fructose-1,6-bisphosphatase/sedoheptulose 1,7-bisphosphatase-like protein
MIQETKNTIQIEKENMERYRKMAIEHKNEILNQNGFCQGAKLIFEVINVTPTTRITQAQNISIRLTLNNQVKSSSTRNIRNLEFNEKFEL